MFILTCSEKMKRRGNKWSEFKIKKKFNRSHGHNK